MTIPGANAAVSPEGTGRPTAERLPAPPASALPRDHRTVWELVSRHKGVANPISVQELSAITGIPERRIQTIKKQLVQKFGRYVGTSCVAGANGYYVIVDEEDRLRTSGNLWRRVISTIEQIRAIDRITDEEVLHALLQRQKAVNACTHLSENESGKSEPAPKRCACGCGEVFRPTRPWSRFVNDDHRQRHHRAGRQLGIDFLEGVA